ncbi:phage tail protein [Massilicoli timonensis]|uniref:phage tail protein n=1 Tax=Massilicoli timonensis TaxID=2015901 RepID=UPI000C8555F7|nr:phage tail protein [Massilicoli timonensis]
MADDFGLKIGLEGEKEFKKALSEINQSFKVLGSEMKVVQSQFDKNDSSVEALTARNKVLNKEIEAQKQKIETLRSALANASEFFGENDRRTQNWQIQLNNATAALNNMERELEQNEKAIDELGDEMQQAARQADNFGDEMEGTAKDADDASSKLDKVGSVVKGLGVAIGASVAAAGAALAGLTKSFLDLAESTREYREDQAKLDAAFTTAGFTAEQAGNAYTDFYSILGEEDRSVEAVNHLAKLCETEEELTQWTDIAAGVWATFGDSLPIEGLTEAANETAKTGQLTGVLADALNWAGTSEDEFQASLDACNSEQERAALITKTLNGLYEDAAENYKELNGDVMDARRAQAELTDAYAQLGAIAEPIMTTLKFMAADVLNEMIPFVAMMGEGLQGVLEGTAGSAETFAEGMRGIVDVLLTQLSTIIPMIGQAILTSLPTLLQAGVDIIVTLLDGIVSALPTLAEAAVMIVLELVNGLLSLLPQLAEAAMQVIATLASGIATALPELIPTIIEILTTVVQTLIENLPLILDAALQLVMGLAQGLLAAIPVLIEALPSIILAIVEFVLGAIPQIIDAGIQLLTSLVSALPEIIVAIVEAIPQIIEGIITAVLGSIPQIIQAGIDLLVALIQALPEIITTIVAAIPEIIGSVVNALINSIPQIVQAGVTLFVSLIKNLPTIIVEIVKAVPQILSGLVSAFGKGVSQLASVGANLVRGLWQGIQSLASWLWNKVSSWISSIWDGICDFFGIHSPSDEMAWIGEMLVEGLAGSINTNGKDAVAAAEGMSKDINDVMHSLADDMTTALPADFSVNGTVNRNDTVSGTGFGGSALITIQQMIVRSEEDIRKISQELYNLIQSGSRAQGHFTTA